ncbi:MAG: hypothetical protein ACNS62_13345 [Candidatus Cyclobacteriaceae bacterium M3_2C_046]
MIRCLTLRNREVRNDIVQYMDAKVVFNMWKDFEEEKENLELSI